MKNKFSKFLLVLAVGFVCVGSQAATVTNVNVGGSANDHTGDPLRPAFIKLNNNDNLLQARINTNDAAIADIQTKAAASNSLARVTSLNGRTNAVTLAVTNIFTNSSSDSVALTTNGQTLLLSHFYRTNSPSVSGQIVSNAVIAVSQITPYTNSPISGVRDYTYLVSEAASEENFYLDADGSYSNIATGTKITVIGYNATDFSLTVNSQLPIENIVQSILLEKLGDSVTFVFQNPIDFGGQGGWFIQSDSRQSTFSAAAASLLSSNSFASTNIPVPTSYTVLTNTHTLGALPTSYRAVLVNLSAEQGYSVGDEVALETVGNDGGNPPVCISWTDSHFYLAMSGTSVSSWNIRKRGTSGGQNFNLTHDFWAIKIYAKK